MGDRTCKPGRGGGFTYNFQFLLPSIQYLNIKNSSIGRKKETRIGNYSGFLVKKLPPQKAALIQYFKIEPIKLQPFFCNLLPIEGRQVPTDRPLLL